MAFEFPKRRERPTVLPLPGVGQMLERMPEGNPAVAASLTRLAVAYRSMIENHSRFMADATVSANARLVRAARHARSQMIPAVEELREARAQASGVRVELLRRIGKLFDFSDSFAQALLATEIRGAIANLPEDQRTARLQQAIEAKDRMTLRAVGGGPAFLTGLAPHWHELARNTVIDLDSEMAASRGAVKAIEEQEQFAKLLEATLIHSTADLIDFPQAAGLEAMATEAVH